MSQGTPGSDGPPGRDGSVGTKVRLQPHMKLCPTRYTFWHMSYLAKIVVREGFVLCPVVGRAG